MEKFVILLLCLVLPSIEFNVNKFENDYKVTENNLDWCKIIEIVRVVFDCFMFLTVVLTELPIKMWIFDASGIENRRKM